jgi:hypothetical protein
MTSPVRNNQGDSKLCPYKFKVLFESGTALELEHAPQIVHRQPDRALVRVVIDKSTLEEGLRDNDNTEWLLESRQATDVKKEEGTPGEHSLLLYDVTFVSSASLVGTVSGYQAAISDQ